jgi:hypothetical protein
MRRFLAMAAVLTVAWSCKVGTDTSSQTTEDPTAPEKSYEFCKLDFGKTFYSVFFGNTRLTMRYTRPYQQIEDIISTEMWQKRCAAVQDVAAGQALVKETSLFCQKVAREYDSSYLFKDVWFEYRRQERAAMLVKEINSVCSAAEKKIAGWLTEVPITFSAPPPVENAPQ